MSSFIIDDDNLDYKLNEHGWQNLNNIMTALDDIMYLLDYPEQSNYWLRYDSQRCDGVRPNITAFPDIIRNHFTMSVNTFFSSFLSEDIFDNFLAECYKFCASLSRSQVQLAYNQMLFIYHCNRNLDL